jgi:hypothetical protein
MENNKMLPRMTCIVALALITSPNAFADGPPTPLSSAFTYQGQLKQGGAPAEGAYHLRFQLWDAPTAGAQVGADIDVLDLVIENGLFTTALNFGPSAFDGSARWLEAAVITNGGSTVTTLSPRQAVTAAPYALFALAVDGPSLTNLNASNLASGVVPAAQLGGTYGNALSLTNAANSFAGAFTGSGAGLTSLDAANVAVGNLAAARLPSGGAWSLSSNLNVDSNTLVVDQANNRLGIGITDPGAKIDVQASNGSNVLFGRRTGGGLAHNLYVDSAGNGSMQLLDSAGTPRVEFANGLTYLNYGNLGIGTTTPAVPLHIARDLDPVMVLHDTGAASTQAGYVAFWNNAPAETAWVGFGTPGSPHFSIVNARSGGDIQLMPASNGSVEIFGDSTIHEGLNVSEFLIVTDDGALVAFNRLISDGSLVDFRQDGITEGTISVTGQTVSYGAFTGCHYGWSDRAIERGTLVVMTGENRRRADDPGAEPIYGIAPSILPNDPRCLGAYLGVLEPAQPPSLDNPHQIMAVGNGDMWVVESEAGGDRGIQPGDYLISSDVEGHAMLDNAQRFPIGHVIARAGETVDWAGVGETVAGRRRQRISVFFESFERGSAANAELASLRAENDDLRVRIEALEQLLNTHPKGSQQ